MTYNPKHCACGWLTTPGEDTCGAWECQLALLGEGQLCLVREDGGWRHYLQGQPVHCGEGVELAGVDWVEGIGDAPQRKLSSPRRWTRVRYESPLASEQKPPALLYTMVDGHSAIITADPGMVFRWPPKVRR